MAARSALESEGFRNVENIKLGGRYPDMVRTNLKGGIDYAEVGQMLESNVPESRERLKLIDEILALKKNDTITFFDKNNIQNRITYRAGDLEKLLMQDH